MPIHHAQDNEDSRYQSLRSSEKIVGKNDVSHIYFCLISSLNNIYISTPKFLTHLHSRIEVSESHIAAYGLKIKTDFPHTRSSTFLNKKDVKRKQLLYEPLKALQENEKMTVNSWC